MRQSRYFAVVYMFVLTAVLSTMLIGLERLTRQQVKTNEQIAFERAVLSVFPQIEIKTSSDIHPIFIRDFVPNKVSGAYEYRPNGQLAGYALPFAGQGFWSAIKGVIGVAADQKTMTGIWFYEQAETPGLGSRIAEPFFYEQFSKKHFVDGPRPVRVKPASEAGENDIQSITGATQTCVRLEKLLNDAIVQWQKTMQEQGK